MTERPYPVDMGPLGDRVMNPLRMIVKALLIGPPLRILLVETVWSENQRWSEYPVLRARRLHRRTPPLRRRTSPASPHSPMPPQIHHSTLNGERIKIEFIIMAMSREG